MTDPNINATPQSVADSLAGTQDGTPLSFREVAQLEPMGIFDLATTAAFPEGADQVTTSIFDVITTLGKLLTATFVASDGNTYNAFDAIMTTLKYVLTVAPQINEA